DQDRRLAAVELTAPFEFVLQDEATTASLERQAAGGEPGPAESGEETPSPARLQLTLDRIDVDRLRPWTSVWGMTWLQPASAGTVSADLSAEVASSARAISLSGEMQFLDVMWQLREGE